MLKKKRGKGVISQFVISVSLPLSFAFSWKDSVTGQVLLEKRLWDGDLHASCLPGSTLRSTPGREGKKARLGRRRWAVMLSQQTLQLTLQGALKPGWPFRRVPNWGTRNEPLHPCIKQSLTAGCPQKWSVSIQTKPVRNGGSSKLRWE